MAVMSVSSFLLFDHGKDCASHPAEEFAAAKDDLVDLTRRGDRGVDRKVCRHVWQQAGGFGVEAMGDGHGRVSDPGVISLSENRWPGECNQLNKIVISV
jgi:hypothetical protein